MFKNIFLGYVGTMHEIKVQAICQEIGNGPSNEQEGHELIKKGGYEYKKRRRFGLQQRRVCIQVTSKEGTGQVFIVAPAASLTPTS